MRFLRPLVLLTAFALMVGSAVQKSPTVDEQGHLFRGVAYVKTGATHFLWGHPLLSSSLNALPLLSEPDLRLPQEELDWQRGDWASAGNAFLWELNSNPHRLVLLGRLPTMWITLLLSAITYRWARQVAGAGAGAIALVLTALDPNVLAHGQLITSDLPLTFFMVLAVYGYWRWAVAVESAASANGSMRERLVSSRGAPVRLAISGLALGAAAATKFSAALILPALALIAVLLMIRWRTVQTLLALVLLGLGAWLTVWAVYRFDISPLPGGAFWDDLAWQFDYLSRPHGAYLLGRSTAWGWWYYFPVAFLVKTPLPTLVLLVWAAVVALSRLRRPSANLTQPPSRHAALFLLVPAVVYLAISLASPLNIGYRHLIPALPFLAIYVGSSLRGPCLSQPVPVALNLRRAGPYLLAALVALISLMQWPDYLPYFNLLAGGPARSWRVLSDSNVDWGQDLPALASWQRQTAEPLKLSYFGVAHPSAYGLQFEALPTWEPGPEQTHPDLQAHNPLDPAPGYYAISVTNLHGLVLGADQNLFAAFRDRAPEARIGGSIFVYRVDPSGPPVSVAFSGLRPAELDPGLHARFQTNNIRVRWFDAATSLIWPRGGGWLAVAGSAPGLPLQRYWPEEIASSGDQRLYWLSGAPDEEWGGQPANLAGILTFLGFRLLPSEPGEVSLVTRWRVLQETTRPVKIFVHALDGSGQIAGQWDGLAVHPASWQAGDTFIQWHHFTVAQPLTAGQIRLTTGIYDGSTLERLDDPLPLD